METININELLEMRKLIFVLLIGYILVFGCDNTVSTTDTTERIIITHPGNVGPGTTNPSAKLHVNGTRFHNGARSE